MKHRLSDYIKCTIDNRGRNPEKYHTSEKYPVIDNYLIKNSIYPDMNAVNRYIDAETFENFLRGYVHKNMPLMTLVGNGIGNVTLAPSDDVTIIQNTIGFECNDNINEIFLYYYLLYKQELIRKFDRGSGQPSIRKTDLLDMEVDIPSMDVQNKIVDILFAIDKKIELNNNMNSNLFEQIRTICTAWLSDYIPFGGIMPSDWLETSLSDIAEFVSGYSYKGAELTNSSTAMATIKNFDRNGGFKLDGYKEIVPSSKLKNTQHADLFDTLVAHTDLTQNADVIGNAELIMSKAGYYDIVFSMDLVKVLPKNDVVSKFLIAAILQDRKFKAHCLGYVNGTTVLHLSKKALPEYKVNLPKDLSMLKPLDDMVTALYKKASSNISENMRLESLRDTLLPKLMSGEIDLSNINI